MKKRVNLRKQGKFYASFEDDAYVIHAILGYKIVNGRIGFPENSIGRVTNKLNDCKVDYVVIVKDEEIEKKHFPSNNYINCKIESHKYFKAKSHNFKIFVALFVIFIISLSEIIVNYPRNEFVLKDRITNVGYDILELIYYE